MEDLELIFKNFQSGLAHVQSQADALHLKSEFLGKQGQISSILRSLKDAPPEKRRELGAKSNVFKEQMEQLFDQKFEELKRKEVDQKLKSQWIDPALRENNLALGLTSAGLHPVSIIQREIEEVFLSMGFEVLDGPHIEDEYHNFSALNTPADHPARDLQDTFWFSDMKHLLRTHTSPIQIRGMESRRPPFRFITTGKVFRCERTDASHEAMFHQVEAMMVDVGISVAHLKYYSQVFLNNVFKREVTIRLRPGYFQFVEPGFELDIQCVICTGKGCSVCKNSGWVELMGCGMVHPEVLKAGNVDPEKYTGFAFGMGLDRLAMMRYGINDIRLLHSGDLRFISQFRSL